jgi:hypothetical protein
VSARRSLFADILKPKPVEAEEPEPSPAQLAPNREKEAPKAKSPKLNKAIDPEYMKLTAYIPRDLHFEIKTAMAADQETDQSAYIERWLRESLKRRQSATGPQHNNSAAPQ